MRKDKHAHSCTQPGIPLDKINDAKLPVGEKTRKPIETPGQKHYF